MVQLKLKAKHWYFIVNDLQQFSASSFFKMLIRLQSATTGVLDEDLITVTVTVDQLISIYNIITSKRENQVAGINKDIKALISDQTDVGVAAADPKWIKIKKEINDIRQAALAVTDAAIIAGKLFLNQIDA